MTDVTWVVALTATGGALELAGLILVVKEIRSDRQAAQDLLRENRVVRPATIRTTVNVHPPTVNADEQEPALEQRLAALEDAYDRKFRMLEELTSATRADLRRVVAEEAAELAHQDRERDVALRSFLHTQITGSLRNRVFGVVLIATGITCTTAAGIWGTVIR